MINFFVAPNLKTEVLSPGAPWDYSPDPEKLEHWRTLPKPMRRKLMAEEKTKWQIYSACGGVAPNLRISKDNPPAVLRGIVCDYDMKIDVDTVVKLLNQVEPAYLPNFVEITLSKNVRLVWVFEREVLVRNSAMASAIIETFIKDELKADILLPGFDENSYKPAEVWTNGGEWFNVNDKPLPWENIFGIVCGAAKRLDFGQVEIPLEVLAAQAEKQFPGRWKGEFKLDNLGVRFWDEKADNPTGCQIKPDGMLCFTGRMPFMSWDAIFGANWCNERRALNLGQAAGETYFDGRHYWQKENGIWRSKCREDVILDLKTKGISAKLARGQTASDAERVLRYVQGCNAIDGAGPLVNSPPGIVEIKGKKLLNLSKIQPLLPSEKTDVTPDDFPWLWKFLNGLFDHVELGALDHFLLWTKRAYDAVLNHKNMMGQAVFLCGPKENGKTLLCFHVLKPLFGNRCENPYDYFTGVTQFNAQLFESFLLAVNDEEGATKEDVKQKFLHRIKAWVVNPEHSYRPLYCNAVTLAWCGRLFLTLNDDHASVGLLPEVNVNTQDKMMFFASRPYEGVWEDRAVIEARIAAELPYFARWLLNWTPPKEIVVPGRMGVKSFFDPRIREISQQQTPAYGLLEVIRSWFTHGVYWAEGTKDWEGTATELMNMLSISSDGFQPVLREWTHMRVARAMTALGRMNATGIQLIESRGARKFKITRAVAEAEEATSLAA